MSVLMDLKKPLAIAMWDFSWLWRHYNGGGFEDWDKALDGLVERGYDAIRIDVFPHLVAKDFYGNLQETYKRSKTDFSQVLWGNQYSIDFNPRKALKEFLEKCKEREIYVGLSTWFFDEDSKRNEQVESIENFVRVWDETLEFLDENKLLENIIYVDLLNEYPLFHGFKWMEKKLGTMCIPIQNHKKFNNIQKEYYNLFISDAIETLSMKWPKIDFMASLTEEHGTPWEDMDLSRFKVLDKHMWFVCLKEFAEETGYFEDIHSFTNDMGFEKCYNKIKMCWNERKQHYINLMENNILKVSETGKKLGIPVGNTEGWGAIYWMDHPYLNWEWIKETGEICAILGAKYNYKFNCTSNFTHPHFKEIWQDVKWHKKVTSIIKNGTFSSGYGNI